MENEKQNITKLVAIIFLMGLIGWGISLFGGNRAPDNTNTDQTIYNLEGEQFQITVEADRIGSQLGNIGQSIKTADRAVERGQAAAGTISAGIERSQQLLNECRGITAENARIFESIGGSAGTGTGTAEGPGK